MFFLVLQERFAYLYNFQETCTPHSSITQQNNSSKIHKSKSELQVVK